MEKLNGLKRVLVLASVSPRRRGFLHQLGYSFEAVAPAVVKAVQFVVSVEHWSVPSHEASCGVMVNVFVLANVR